MDFDIAKSRLAVGKTILEAGVWMKYPKHHSDYQWSLRHGCRDALIEIDPYQR